MGTLVGIADPLPAFRFGLMAELSTARLGAAEPDDLAEWCADPGDKVAVLTVTCARQWAILEQIHGACAAVPVVVLLDEPDLEGYRRALRTGATAAMARTSVPSRIVAAVEAARDDSTLLPAGVAVLLAAELSTTIGMLDAEEARWLRRLADGLSVDEVAWDEGYSTRTMYRRLRVVYQRLGAHDRTRALVRALELGLIKAPDRSHVDDTVLEASSRDPEARSAPSATER